ncbi:MAG TPA: hypothetical protein VF794_06330 [Archangium sp.]|uniref:Kelch repeat-containing protein n=1 Tax=Archangium sp. TaxID=1872627 RepID=UPI002EDB6851
MIPGVSRLLPILVLVGAMVAGCDTLDDDDSGGDVTPQPPPATTPSQGTCSASRMVPSGALHTSQSEINYGGGKALAKSIHKVDVDIVEDGCVGTLELTVSLASGQCPLKLSFKRVNGTYGGLTEAQFSADSTCPGFLDSAEGVYLSQPGFTPLVYMGPREVPVRMATSVCMTPVRLGFPDQPIRLFRSGSGGDPLVLTLNLKDLVLEGELFSKGDTSPQCFDATSCGPGLRDGGDGWCVQEGKCSQGYHNGGDGRCVPSSGCAAGYHLSPTGSCTLWKSTTPLPSARARAGTVAAGGYLYVVGGADSSTWFDEVWFAPLRPEGGVGEWTRTTPLPLARVGARVVTSGKNLYVVGGNESCGRNCTVGTDQVLGAELQADGSLGAWSVVGTVPGKLDAPAVQVHGGNLYVVGTIADPAKVLFAPLQADGKLGTWRSGPSLPEGRQYHDAVVAGDVLYVVGGLQVYQVRPQPSVYRASLAAEGGVGAWSTSRLLPYPCDSHAVGTHGGHLYVLAGRCEIDYGSYRSDLVQYAPLQPDGSLGTWSVQQVLEPGREAHGGVIHDDFVYLLGGQAISPTYSTGRAVVPHVQMARLRPSGGVMAP